MQEVRGQLAKGILPDVLRHVAFLRDSGRLILVSDTRRALISIRAGRPVHAACRRADGSAAQGLEALAVLLGWDGGTYRFEPLRPSDSVPAQPGGPGRGSDDTLAGDLEELLEAAQARIARNGSAHGSHAAAVFAAFGAPAATAASVDPRDRAGADRGAPHEARGNEPPSDASTGEAITEDLFMPGAPVAEAGPRAVLSRLEAPTVPDDVALPRGALSLWLRLDGAAPLGEWAEALGAEVERVVGWAERLVDAGLAQVEPEPIVAPEFVPRLTEELIEMMGPMAEILVEDAVDELGLDPAALPADRVPELVEALTSQLPRSDWQMRLRGRATRLRAEMTIPPRAKEPR